MTKRLYLFNATLILFSLILFSCTSPYQEQVNSYNSSKNKVNLGMSMNQTLTILPYPEKTDSYLHDGKIRDIVYIRSGWISDSKLTDDELTPYIFEDKILIGIGWAMLGGAKTTGTPDSGATYCYEYWNAYLQMYQLICT